MPDFRFSCNIFGIRSRDEFVQTCRRAEQLGYDAVFAADHLGIAAPFSTVVTAAMATERLRVGTLVLNAPFWNPALLAREIATADVLTDGRLDIGLGAGHMKWEFDEAGIPWHPFETRASHLAATISELSRLFATDGYEQQAPMRAAFDFPALQPLQRRGFNGHGPPLIIGGTGNRILRLAAEKADTVSISGLFQVNGQPPGTMRIATATEADERASYTRTCAGSRASHLEWHALTQIVIITDDRPAAATQLAERYGNLMSPTDILETPFTLIGTIDEIVTQLHHNHTRYGFTHYTIHAPYTETFAPVIPHLR